MWDSTSMERAGRYLCGGPPAGMRKMINRAYVVMVAVNENHVPVSVPGLVVETESEKAEWEGGEKRYLLRKQEKKRGILNESSI